MSVGKHIQKCNGVTGNNTGIMIKPITPQILLTKYAWWK